MNTRGLNLKKGIYFKNPEIPSLMGKAESFPFDVGNGKIWLNIHFNSNCLEELNQCCKSRKKSCENWERRTTIAIILQMI